MKPCPFCGSKALVAEFLLGCAECLVTFSFKPNDKDEYKIALDKWNTRKDD